MIIGYEAWGFIIACLGFMFTCIAIIWRFATKIKAMEDNITATGKEFSSKCEIIELQSGHLKETFDAHVKLNGKEHDEFKGMLKNIQEIKESVIKILTKLEEAEKK